jgi:hypothetical protein
LALTADGEHTHHERKFFGSFLQKRTACGIGGSAARNPKASASF